MKGLGGLLIAILSAVALWQFAVEWQRGTFGVAFRPNIEALGQDEVLRSVGPPLTKYGEHDGGETWQYTNGRIVRFNYRGEVVETRGFSTFITPEPGRRRGRGSAVWVKEGTQPGAADLPPNVSYQQGMGGGYPAPLPAPTPSAIDQQRGWQSSSPLDQRPR